MGVVDNFIHMFAPLTANCRDFDARWQAARANGANGVGGAWEGEWVSAATGHRGRLRCVIDPCSAAMWRLWFRGEYSKVFRACYSTEFQVQADGEGFSFSGGSNLGALAGGAYTYAGSATATSLVCSYRSARDHGEFRMTRI